MFLSNPLEGAFGLDIGDLSIKLVQLRRHHPPFKEPVFSVEEIRRVTLPLGYIVNGEIQQPELVRKKLLHLLGKDGQNKPIQSRWVVADLPEPKTFLKLITVETPAKEMVYDDVAYAAKKHLPFDIEETYLDWQLVRQTGQTCQVLIGAVPKVIADSYTYLLESVDLSPVALEIEAQSIARCLITGAKSYEGEARALLDIGATRSSLIIYDHDSIQFSRSLKFSSELLTTALVQELKTSFEAAEKMRLANGLRYDKNQPKYLTVVSGLVEKLIDEVKQTFLFYKEHFSDTNPITHITMCGGLANFENLDNVIARKLKISAHPANVWKNLTAVSTLVSEKTNSLVLASAIGLALRAACSRAENQ